MLPLQVVETAPQGAYLDGGVYGPLFVPKSQLPPELKGGDTLRVFLYQDSGRVLATARHPYLELGMVGALKVVEVNAGTAYLELGIPKDLVVPVSEQKTKFEVGSKAVVYVAQDERGRLFGTQRFHRYLQDSAPAGRYRGAQRVVCVPLARTPLGYRAAVDDTYFGVIYAQNDSAELTMGKRYDGYVLRQREDGRLDLTLQQPGRAGVESAAVRILRAIPPQGRLSLGDHSPPEEIERELGMSKGKFKKAIGHLYRQRLITISDGGLSLTAAGLAQVSDLSHIKAEGDEDPS